MGEKIKKSIVFLLVTAGLGGVLFDFGGTIIGPAIPYIGPVKDNPGSLGLFTTAEISRLSSAVVLSAAFACLAAGWLAERFGRKPMMLLSAALAAFACPPICLFDGAYWPFFAGRVLQGASAGVIGVVAPMYLAECLPARIRGKGAGMFQLLDFVGISLCALVGLAVVRFVGAVDADGMTAALKALAWKTVFWSSAAPAVLFFFGALGLRESPRWLCRRGRRTEALAALTALVGEAEGRAVLGELDAADRAEAAEKAALAAAARSDSLLQRKYALPFFISLAVLVCNQAIGFNAVQYFSVMMFKSAGLSHQAASVANVAVWLVPIPVTALACWLVDRAGRKILLKAGTLGMTAAFLGVAVIFRAVASGWTGGGWLSVAAIALYVASFSVGPGVVVWLALSELMPARIRANGMAVCLFVNQMTAFAIADVFLRWVEASGYSTVLFWLAGFAFVYFLVAALLLPETKGRTLEEIEAFFSKTNTGDRK